MHQIGSLGGLGQQVMYADYYRCCSVLRFVSNGNIPMHIVCSEKGKLKRVIVRPVRLAYQPPANSTFLSEQTSHQQPASSTFLSELTSTSHQPPAKRTGW
jgi:hypothetical protein